MLRLARDRPRSKPNDWAYAGRRGSGATSGGGGVDGAPLAPGIGLLVWASAPPRLPDPRSVFNSDRLIDARAGNGPIERSPQTFWSM